MKETILALMATALVASLNLGCSNEEDLTGHDEFMKTNAPPPSGPPGSTMPAPPIDPPGGPPGGSTGGAPESP